MCNLHSTPHFSAFRLKVSHLWRRFFWMSSFGLYLVKKTVQYIFIEVSLTDMLSSFASLWFPMFFTVLFSFLRRIYYPPRSVIIFTIIIDFFFLTSPKKKLIFFNHILILPLHHFKVLFETAVWKGWNRRKRATKTNLSETYKFLRIGAPYIIMCHKV